MIGDISNRKKRRVRFMGAAPIHWSYVIRGNWRPEESKRELGLRPYNREITYIASSWSVV